MGEGQIGGENNTIWESEPLPNKAAKARAAAELGWKAVRSGIKKEEAANRAHHELKHALNENGNQSTMALEDRGDNKVGFVFKPNRVMTLEEEEKSLMGPGTDMSDSDKKRVAEIRKQKKSFLAKILGL